MSDEHKQKYANDALDALASAGGVEGPMGAGVLFKRQVYFDSPRVKVNKRSLADFARAIRKCTNAERSACLQADIDRMGKVIGWHLSK